MKFKVIVHTPTAGKVQHIINAETREEARAKAFKAHPQAEIIEVERAFGEVAP